MTLRPRLTLPLTLGLSLAASAGAHACSLPAPAPGTLIPGEVVFVGTVEAVPPPGTDADPQAPVAYAFRVERTLRGAAPGPSVTVHTGAHGGICGTSFRLGSRYVVSTSRVRGASVPPLPDGALVTGLGSGNREIPLGAPVPADALRWPAPPGFDERRSHLTVAGLRAFRPFPVAETRFRWSGVRRIERTRNSVTLVAAGGLRRRTTQMCRARPGSRAAPVAPGPSAVPHSGIREGRLVVFTGRQEVRFDGVTPAEALAAARGLARANHPAYRRPATPGYVAAPLAPPVPGARLRVPCPIPGDAPGARS